MRRLMIIVPLVLAACGRPPASDHPVDANAARQELLAADRAFAAATDSNRLDGWLRFYADDAVRLRMAGPTAQGLDSIRAFDAPLFADSAARLLWDPTASGVFADGRHGYTTGRSVMIKPRPRGGVDTLYSGRYVTIWRRGTDGRWKVILDTGA